MKPPIIAVFAVLVGLLASCSSSDERVSHPTVAMLTLEQPKPGWTGGEKNPHELVLRAVDSQPVSDPFIRAGKLLSPGWHTLTLGAQGHAAAAMGARFGGDTAATMGARFDANASSRYNRTLSVNLQLDHDYVARMKKHKDHYDYVIEDVTTGRVIARSKD